MQAECWETVMQVLLVDDHPVILEVMQAVLRRCLAPTAIHAEKDLESGLRRARRLTRLDLVVLDLLLPGCQGIDALRRFRAEFPKEPVIVISAIDDGPVIRAAMAAGANGYIPKTSGVEVIESALLHVAAGGTYVPPDARGDRPHGFDSQDLAAPEFGLSARQLEVLKRIVKGLHNKQIADELQISENTVKHHTHEVFKALGVTTRTEALLVSVRRHFPLEG